MKLNWNNFPEEWGVLGKNVLLWRRSGYFMELHICDLYGSFKERLKVEFDIYLCVIIWKR